MRSISLTVVFLLMTTLHASEFPTMPSDTLDARHQNLAIIAALTAQGDLERLKPRLAQGLDDGLSINEITEALVQLYAYAGFPRSLNGIATFMAVVEERKQAGIVDPTGPVAIPPPAGWDRDAYGARVRADLLGQQEIPDPAGYQLFAPAVDDYLKQHLFADIFQRDVLDHRQRELVTVAILAAMDGCEPQLRVHCQFAQRVGVSLTQMSEMADLLAESVTATSAKRLRDALAQFAK